ncbi:MAG TPA: hypothetical protein VKE98_08445 [Gemmataceae bacterium]|nr:hypothetical protein [Gemmataceae bacterium]
MGDTAILRGKFERGMEDAFGFVGKSFKPLLVPDILAFDPPARRQAPGVQDPGVGRIGLGRSLVDCAQTVPTLFEPVVLQRDGQPAQPLRVASMLCVCSKKAFSFWSVTQTGPSARNSATARSNWAFDSFDRLDITTSTKNRYMLTSRPILAGAGGKYKPVAFPLRYR